MFKKIIPKDKLFWKYFLSYILIFIIPYLIFFNLGYIRLKHLTNINNAKYYNIKLSEFQTFFDNISKDIYNIKDMIDRSKLFREMVFTKNVYEKEIEGFFLRELRNELKTLRDSSPHIMDILINLDGDDTIYSIYGLFEKPTLYSTNLDIHTNVFGLEQTIPINSFLIQKQLYINSTPQEFIIYGDRLSTYSTKNTKGSLRIIINMNSIKESFSNMFNDNSLLFFATTNNNTDNTPIFCNNTDIVIENNLLTMLDHNKIIGLNNENYVKFYVPANYLDLKYLLLIPDDIYSRELKTLNIYVIFLNFIVFVICILISFMFSKKYFTPIDNIIRKLDTKGSIHQDGMLFINENIDTILNEKNVLNYELKTYRSNIRQLLLHKLFIPEEINDDFIEKLKQYDIEFEDNYFCAVKVSLPKAVLKTNQSNKYLKLTLILKKIVVQTLKQFLVTGYIIEQESFKDFIILFNIDNYVTILKMLSEISSKYNVLDSDISPSFGIGSIYQGIENISNSYKEAVKALKYRIIEGEGAVIQYNVRRQLI